MPFEVSVISQKPPVLLLDIAGSVHSADMLEHLDSLEAEITKNGWLDTIIYLIVDVTASNISFIDIVTGVATHATARRGSSNDPLTEGAFVGTGAMVKILREMLNRKSTKGNLTQIFASRDEALAYFMARDRVRNRANRKTNHGEK